MHTHTHTTSTPLGTLPAHTQPHRQFTAWHAPIGHNTPIESPCWVLHVCDGLDQYGGYDDVAFYQSGHLKFLVFFTLEFSNWHRRNMSVCKKLPLADTNQMETVVRMEPSAFGNCPKWLAIAVRGAIPLPTTRWTCLQIVF